MTETEPLTPAELTGRNIALARKFAGMSQKQLAALLGTAPSYISDWERGAHEPRRDTWPRLEQVLERPRWWFYKDHTLDDEPSELDGAAA